MGLPCRGPSRLIELHTCERPYLRQPNFFGANPAEVREGPRQGLRVLGHEEDLGRDLLASLAPDQKKIAIVDPTAYPDILTTNSRKAALNGQPSGLPVSKMTKKQRDLLDALLAEYIGAFPDQVAEARGEQVKKAANNLYFAWAGVEQRGGPHYYRIQAPSFLIEYDNTQNNANHIHTVWRDFERFRAGSFEAALRIQPAFRRTLTYRACFNKSISV